MARKRQSEIELGFSDSRRGCQSAGNPVTSPGASETEPGTLETLHGLPPGVPDSQVVWNGEKLEGVVSDLSIPPGQHPTSSSHRGLATGGAGSEVPPSLLPA